MKSKDITQPFDPKFVEYDSTPADLIEEEEEQDDECMFVDSECEEPDYADRYGLILKVFVAICCIEFFVLCAFIGSRLTVIPWGSICIVIAVLLLLFGMWLWGYNTHANHCQKD